MGEALRRRVTQDSSLIGHGTQSESSLPAMPAVPQSLTRCKTVQAVSNLSKDPSSSRLRRAKNPAEPSILDRTSWEALCNKTRGASSSKSGSKEDLDGDSPAQFSPEILRQAMARKLCRKHEIEVKEACRILEGFEQEAAKSSGSIAMAGFRAVVKGLAAHRDLNENSVNQAWLAAKSDPSASIMLGQVDMDAFFQWWTMEEKWAHLKAAAAWIATPEALAELADELGVGVRDLSKVKEVYDVYDDNGTGIMDFSEFGEALKDLLRLKEEPPKDVTSRHWAALDDDDSGEVDFPEFATWYLGMFDASTGELKTAGL